MTYPSDCPRCHSPLHLAEQHCPRSISCPWLRCLCGALVDADGHVIVHERTEREP